MQQIISSFDPANDGWQYMWVIVLVGAAALGFAVNKFIYIVLKSSKGRGVMMGNIANLLKAGKYDEAMSVAGAHETPLARIIYAILSRRDKGKDGMTEAMDEVFLTEAPRISRYMTMIQICASVATLLGLLGTIYGLIYTFDAVANKPAAERPKALADGIAVAMATTFLGLIVAIPLLLIQGGLAMQAERLVEEMEEKGLKIINILA
jgi:biopolymer transport protein ExbB/TolQ